MQTAFFDEQKTEKRSRMVNTVCVLLLIAVFAVTAMWLMNAGLSVYRNVVMAGNDNFELRTSLSYVATKIRQFDVNGSPEVRNRDGLEMLVLPEEMDGYVYETLVYHRDGKLCELISEKGAEPQYDFGFEILEIDEFHFREINDGIELTAVNSKGESETMIVYARSERRPE